MKILRLSSAATLGAVFATLVYMVQRDKGVPPLSAFQAGELMGRIVADAVVFMAVVAIWNAVARHRNARKSAKL